MTARPYMRLKVTELEDLAARGFDDVEFLLSIRDELQHRKTNASSALDESLKTRIAHLLEAPTIPVSSSLTASTVTASPNQSVVAATDDKYERPVDSPIRVDDPMPPAGVSPYVTMILGGIIIAFFLIAITAPSAPKAAPDPFKQNVIDNGDVHVDGYRRDNGTYVAPHARTQSNHTQSDNFSKRGNVNFYTEQPGTR